MTDKQKLILERIEKLKASTESLNRFLQQPPEIGLHTWWVMLAESIQKVSKDATAIGEGL